MRHSKTIIALSGPSGTGKTTALQLLAKHFRKPYDLLLEYTTRERRETELDFADVKFISRETFQAMQFDYKFNRNTDYYGLHEQTVEQSFEKVDFLLTPSTGRILNCIRKDYEHKVNILTVLILTDKNLIEERIAKQKISAKFKEKRLNRLRNKIVNPKDYDLVIDNNGSLQDLEARLIKDLISIF